MQRILLFSLFILSASTSWADATYQAEIDAVTQGLRPTNSFKGDANWTLKERMANYGVPGVGIAVIKDRKVIWHEVFGYADRQTGERITPDTLLQAGSISKPVAAYGALKMIQQGLLSLDEPVNDKLTSWHIPDSPFTAEAQVNLTHLTSHTGGLTVHGFPGYAPGVAVPTLVQVLDGTPPSNTPAIFVNQAPGEGWRYSGGGYSVMQQLMIDVAGKSFPSLMHESVLAPLGMINSTYEQPLPKNKLLRAGAGVLPDGRDVPGKRHTYPEMAAAGLWTTAQDLATFAADVQLALQGKSEVLSQTMAEAMLEPVVPQFGRGFGLFQRDGNAYFQHGGWDEGFCAQLTASRDAGVGVAVMINSNHPRFLSEVVNAVAAVYEWPGYTDLEKQPVPAKALSSYPGRYRYDAEQSFSLTESGGRLFMQYVGESPQELLHLGDNVFVRREREARITFSQEGDAPVFQFILDGDNRQSHQQLNADELLPRDLLNQGAYKLALEGYRELADAGEPIASEGNLNQAGLAIFSRGFHDLGLGMLMINAELRPRSANTWDSIGYALVRMGLPKQAVVYYEKALGVDPDFASAKEALAELEASE